MATTTGGNFDQSKTVSISNADGSYVLDLVLNPDALACHASIVVQQPGVSLSVDQLRSLVESHGLTHGIDRQKLAEIVAAIGAGISKKDLLVARGTPPVKGSDGYFEFCEGVYNEQPQFSESEDGTIDFRQLHVFGNVKPGQRIGTVKPPGRGREGVSVTGQRIEAPPGVPFELILGDAVSGPDAVGNVVADMAGRVLYDGSTLAVTEEYLIEGDVDLEVGHIDFVGFVEVRGDVLDGFNISAGKGVRVCGIVGACRIHSEGDIELRGMAGKGEGKITCRGNLVAHFLNDVEVECSGNISVSNEIRNSLIKCSGTVSVPKGHISGGECIALKGIEAKKIGAVSGVPTELEIGIDFRVLDQLKKYRSELHEATEDMREINNILASLSERFNSAAPLTLAEKARILELTEQLDSQETVQKDLSTKIELIQNRSADGAIGKLNVKSLLFEGTVIAIGKAREEIKTERSGPLSIIENSVDHKLRYLSLSPLSKTPQSIEKELLEMEAAAQSS